VINLILTYHLHNRFINSE